MKRLVHALAIACLAACDPLVDTGYAGDPLARLQGIVSSTAAIGTTPTGAKGAVLWQTVNLWGLTDFTRLPLSLEFPVYWFDIVARPRDESMLEVASGEPAIAEGYLHIVKATAGAMARGDDFLATEYDHALIYVTAPLPPGGPTAQYLGGELAPGYHVVTRTHVAVLTPPQQMLVERCVALATMVPPDQARAACTAQRLYRLDPAPDDLTTLLRFRLELPSP